MRNLVSFHLGMFESLKIGTLMVSFYLKKKMFELKMYRRVLCHENEERCKIEEKLTRQFKIDMMNLTNFDLSTQKSQSFAV